MTPQSHADHLLQIWQQRKAEGFPPHLRLLETREAFARLADETMSMFRAPRSNIERAEA